MIVPAMQAAIDRLVFEAQYVRDVMHLAGAGTITISAGSLAKLYDGLVQVIDVLRAQQPATGAPPAAAQPPASGG